MRSGSPANLWGRRLTRPSTLIVEDDREIAGLLRETLTGAGHDVTVAFDGDDGLAHAALIRPDLILLDACVPGVSGTELCRLLRADFTTATAGIIFVTGRDSMTDVEAAFDA